jgi:triacylglycerol lipase
MENNTLLLHAMLSQAVYTHPTMYKCPQLDTSFDNSVYIYRSRETDTIHVIFKGTDSIWDTKTNVFIMPTKYPYAKGYVHTGYLEHYQSIRADVFDYIFKETLAHYPKPLTIHIAGHSMGGALASLMGLDCSELLPRHKINVYTYGAPPFCDDKFSKSFHKHYPRLQVNRVIHKDDIVPHVPLPWKHPTSSNKQGIIIDHRLKHAYLPHALKYHSMSSYIQGLKRLTPTIKSALLM